MVRIFTTSFLFNHQNYDAIVSMVKKEGKVDVTVKVMDVALQQLLPGGTLNLDSGTRPNNPETEDSLTQSLMKSLTVAVERHLVS